MIPNNTEISNSLFNFRQAKEEYKASGLNLARLAVLCGMDQKDSIDRTNAMHFLDGYLIASGVIQSHRKNLNDASAAIAESEGD